MTSQKQTIETNTLVIGASAAGLAVDACLKKQDIPHLLVEKTNQVGTAWRNHYDRLHLHTSKALSHLPYFRFPAHVLKYPSKQQVIDYLESYAAHCQLDPVFGQEVTEVRRKNDSWESTTQDTRYLSQNLVVPTGYTRKPYCPSWPDQEKYRGRVLHSSEYKNGEPFKGKDVLVVGFGNSGGEIAIDLWVHGARPALSVRSPVNIVPRDMHGFPILGWSIVLSFLPTRLADFLSKPLLRLYIPDLSSFGLKKSSIGPLTQIRKKRRIPLLDVGTVKLVKQRKVTVYPDIDRVTPQSVRFKDGREKAFEAVVLATGYHPAVSKFLTRSLAVCDERGVPRKSGEETALPGLYFCGFYVAPTGMFPQISKEANRIARHIARKSGK